MPIIDLHCDTISILLKAQNDGIYQELLKNDLHVDLYKMHEGNYIAQFFAMFVPLVVTDPWKTCLEMIEVYKKEITKNSHLINFALSYDDVISNQKKGLMSAILTVEEGGVTNGDLEKLHDLYHQGVRLITLTWNFNNAIGHPNILIVPNSSTPPNMLIPNTTDGLTEQGILFVQEMEKLGMIIDVSHLSDKGFEDCLKYTNCPIIASHSNARSICPNIRNMSDEMIIKLAKRGGVIGINYCPAFLNQNYPKENYVVDIIKHIKYIRDLAGIDCIALGSDFDGIGGKLEINDASKLSMLIDSLKENGFTEAEIDKITYQNALRIIKTMLKK